MTDIFINRFWTEYRKSTSIVDGAPKVETRAIDMVAYSPKASIQTSEIVARISDISRVSDDPMLPERSASRMAQDRWRTIEPHYKAWKEGHELSVDGTPIETWAAISTHQASILRAAKIVTIEQVAGLNDAGMDRAGLPNMRFIVSQAKEYMKNRDRSEVATVVAEMQRRIEELEALQGAGVDEADRPKRGRPPKARADETEEKEVA